jgi:hypothetical protein
MNMDFVGFLKESTFGSLNSIFDMAKIVIPLMIVMEMLKDLNILDKISDFFKPVAKFFGISSESTFPLVIGLIFGLAYGAGVIIESAKENNLSKKDLYILIIFLVACHSVFEDTLLFVAMGANGFLLLPLRIGIAIVISFMASKILDKININKNKLPEHIL